MLEHDGSRAAVPGAGMMRTEEERAGGGKAAHGRPDSGPLRSRNRHGMVDWSVQEPDGGHGENYDGDGGRPAAGALGATSGGGVLSPGRWRQQHASAGA